MALNLIERVLKTIRSYDMIAPGDIVLAAVSGGPDSALLLHCLAKLKNKLKIKEVVVCNLDHGLRGRESRADSLFVRDCASELGLKFMHKRVDLKNTARGNLSTEELARKVRYEFFNKAAAKTGANVIATGHTLDDQAETVLIRVIRGASLKGMAGISPVRREGHLRVIRPLIELEKSEILRYLADSKMPCRIDSTNAEPVYFRNVVRSEVMPFLERFNPRIKRALSSMAEHLREDFEFIAEAKDRICKNVLRKSARRVEIRLKDIVMQPKALQKEILRDSLESAGGEVKKLSFRHWKELENLMKYGRNGNSIHLPGGIKAARSADFIIFARI